MSGLQQPQCYLRMPRRELARKFDGNHLIWKCRAAPAGLLEIRLVFILGGVLDELEAERAFFEIRIMEEFTRSLPLPFSQILGRKPLPPAPWEFKRRAPSGPAVRCWVSGCV